VTGISYAYIASELPRFDPRAAAGRTVVARLDNGYSLWALRAGRSVAATMGFALIAREGSAITPGALSLLPPVT
jgi:acetate kinase